jgi:hypothetical protein
MNQLKVSWKHFCTASSCVFWFDINDILKVSVGLCVALDSSHSSHFWPSNSNSVMLLNLAEYEILTGFYGLYVIIRDMVQQELIYFAPRLLE